MVVVSIDFCESLSGNKRMIRTGFYIVCCSRTSYPRNFATQHTAYSDATNQWKMKDLSEVESGDCIVACVNWLVQKCLVRDGLELCGKGRKCPRIGCKKLKV